MFVGRLGGLFGFVGWGWALVLGGCGVVFVGGFWGFWVLFWVVNVGVGLGLMVGRIGVDFGFVGFGECFDLFC